jgi:NAD(P)H-quinone oxidoreductase subunit 5
MNLEPLPLLPIGQTLLLLAPIVTLVLAALAAGRSAVPAWGLARGASSAALLLVLADAMVLAFTQPGQGWGLRIDAIGATVALLVSFIGWCIVRYSQTYLAAEAGEARYIAWLLATLAAVLLVVLSNHLLLMALAWMATSLALHRLLTFFPSRPAALVAAHKKYVVGRVADLLMLCAVGLFYAAFGTLQIDQMLLAATQTPGLPLTAQVATLMVVLAVLLKTAQLPFHGWLIQVMEAPTPVSALLHAGVVNLGGVVLIRLAPVVAELPLAMGLLVLAGATTAVIAALVMTTRISIKVMLAWSTTAQMGFMVMQCGLGLWEMALLHLVAHSLYKAHCFLAAGGTVRQTLVRQLAPAAAPPSAGQLLLGAGVALGATTAAAWALNALGVRLHATPALGVMAGILTLALVPLLRSTGTGATGGLKLAASAFALASLYFGLHAWLATWASQAALPPGQVGVVLVALAFTTLFALQSALTTRPQGALATRLYPAFYGGLFLDERFSRWVFRLWPLPAPAGPASGRAPHHAPRATAHS